MHILHTMSGQDDAQEERRTTKPYSSRHPIPTIGRYREEKAARQEAALSSDAGGADTDDAERTGVEAAHAQEDESNAADEHGHDGEDDEAMHDTSQVDSGAGDARQRRKDMKSKKSNKKERAEREVTDPITHLPVTIHDFTDDALKKVDYNDPPPGSTTKTATGLSGKSKSDEELEEEGDEAQLAHNELTARFPPPDFDALRAEVTAIAKEGVTFGLGGAAIILFGALVAERWLRESGSGAGGRGISVKGGTVWVIILAAGAGAVLVLLVAVRDWTGHKVNDVFQDEVWAAHRQEISKKADHHETETTVWLNSLLRSVWPLINPDLFASLGDTLEDVMQASLPSLVRMVSVDDIGQGSEALRILGIRWLPTGAAAKSVTKDGKLSSEEQTDGGNNEEGGDDAAKKDGEDGNDQSHAIAEGMQAEEGDFVNLEIAFAYRTRSSSKMFKDRSKDMHLYLAFYLPGNIKVPVWVDLQGIIGTVRLRLQLTPDPPFFALCTITFLGQPKVNLSCMPLSKHAVNIMDVPLISKFVQSSVDAAMSQYVAPKSLTLDLKDMLAGDDFKKDTNARGVLMINIKRGFDFKMADTPVPLIKDGKSDPYVSVAWAKFGKVLWSTRILTSEMEPAWEETGFVLVTTEELNIHERIRVQLWDSDRMDADDDLGRIEVDLKELMTNDESNGKMWRRTDGFKALKSGEDMPGKLEWEVGYFSKTRIQKCQFEQQTYDPEVRNMEQLKKTVDERCERKLREAMLKERKSKRDESELEQQKAQDLKVEQDAMIISAPPPEGYPSGLFSIQIHNITGLELERLSKNESDDKDVSHEEEAGEGLPSSYCNIVINHNKTFKTRTKPQNAKPFFNAGCERFIRDWRDCEVFVAVKDSRQDEDDALLGIVHLPLNEIFAERAQVNGFWPLSGGIGHGRIRLSMVWRSVQLQAPSNLLGWNYGTVEVQSTATSQDCPEDVRVAKLKFRTSISSAKLYLNSEDNTWRSRKDKNLLLAVQKRYSSCMSIAFKNKHTFGNNVTAFCVLWLKDIPDEEEQELELPIWKGDFKRATACCLDDYGEKVGTLKVKLTLWAGMVSKMILCREFLRSRGVLTCRLGERALKVGEQQPEPPGRGRDYRYQPRQPG